MTEIVSNGDIPYGKFFSVEETHEGHLKVSGLILYIILLFLLIGCGSKSVYFWRIYSIRR